MSDQLEDQVAHVENCQDHSAAPWNQQFTLRPDACEQHHGGNHQGQYGQQQQGVLRASSIGIEALGLIIETTTEEAHSWEMIWAEPNPSNFLKR